MFWFTERFAHQVARLQTIRLRKKDKSERKRERERERERERKREKERERERILLNLDRFGSIARQPKKNAMEGPMDGRTDWWIDKASYYDARWDMRKVNCDQPTDQRMDKVGRSTQLRILKNDLPYFLCLSPQVLQAKISISGPKSQPPGPNPSPKAQISQGFNPSLEAQIPALKSKSSLVTQVL